MSCVIGSPLGSLRILIVRYDHLQGVVDHQPAEQRLADAGDELDRLGDHDRPDRRAQHAEHAALGAGRDHPGRRRHRVEVAVVGAVLVPEDADLALEPVDRAPHVRLAEQHAGVVDQVAGGEVVRPVQDQVVRPEDVQRVVGVQPLLVQDHVDVRVDLGDRLLRRQRLGLAEVGHAVDHLALQVGLVDHVEVDDAEGAHAGGGQVEQSGRAEPAGPDDQHLRVLEPLLPGHPDVRDDQVAAVAGDLLDRQLLGRLDQGRQRHGFLLRPRPRCQLTRSPPSLTPARVSRHGRPSRSIDVEDEVREEGWACRCRRRGCVTPRVCCIITGASAPLRGHCTVPVAERVPDLVVDHVDPVRGQVALVRDRAAHPAGVVDHHPGQVAVVAGRLVRQVVAAQLPYGQRRGQGDPEVRHAGVDPLERGAAAVPQLCGSDSVFSTAAANGGAVVG